MFASDLTHFLFCSMCGVYEPVWGSQYSAGMCQPNIPALYRAPALLGVGFWHRIPMVLTDFTGNIEGSGTIQPALFGSPRRLYFYPTTATAHPDYFFILYYFFHSFTFQLVDKPWSQVSSLLPPASCLQFA